MIKSRLKSKYRAILNIVILIFALICLVTAIYSITNIIIWKSDVQENDKIQDKIMQESITIIESAEEELEIKHIINFNQLRELNKDAIAYLKVNNTNIDYIVVKGKDNSYYLNHNFNKEYNVAGWIFADYKNKFDESDKNIVIYGHNIKNGSMFGTLNKILDKKWQENKENLEISLITEKGQYKYQLFSVYSITPEDYYISTEFKNNNDFNNFVKKLQSRSIYDYDTEVTGEDKILTLSSCIDDGKKRIVLHAKLI